MHLENNEVPAPPITCAFISHKYRETRGARRDHPSSSGRGEYRLAEAPISLIDVFTSFLADGWQLSVAS